MFCNVGLRFSMLYASSIHELLLLLLFCCYVKKAIHDDDERRHPTLLFLHLYIIMFVLLKWMRWSLVGVFLGLLGGY